MLWAVYYEWWGALLPLLRCGLDVHSVTLSIIQPMGFLEGAQWGGAYASVGGLHNSDLVDVLNELMCWELLTYIGFYLGYEHVTSIRSEVRTHFVLHHLLVWLRQLQGVVLVSRRRLRRHWRYLRLRLIHHVRFRGGMRVAAFALVACCCSSSAS